MATKTKSEKMREMFAAGKSIADVARDLRVNYAFAYGVAARAGYAETAAKRRPEPNAKIADVIRAVRPEWGSDRVTRTAAAIAAGLPVPTK